MSEIKPQLITTNEKGSVRKALSLQCKCNNATVLLPAALQQLLQEEGKKFFLLSAVKKKTLHDPYINCTNARTHTHILSLLALCFAVIDKTDHILSLEAVKIISKLFHVAEVHAQYNMSQKPTIRPTKAGC